MNWRRNSVIWFVAGILLIARPFINKYDTWDSEMLICGLCALAASALFRFQPEFMRYNAHKLLGIWLVIAGVYCCVHGIFFSGLGGFVLCIFGVFVFLTKF